MVELGDLSAYNMHKVDSDPLSAADAATIARKVLEERVKAFHRTLPTDAPLTMRINTFERPPKEPRTAFLLDWHDRFSDAKLANASDWDAALQPALYALRQTVKAIAPGRPIVIEGKFTLPTAFTLGVVFRSPGGTPLIVRQDMGVQGGGSGQDWDLSATRRSSLLSPDVRLRAASNRDLAVVISVIQNAAPEAGQTLAALNLPVRAVIEVGQHDADGKWQRTALDRETAADAAFMIQEAIQRARSEYNASGTVHVFMAGPAGFGVLIGQLLNTLSRVVVYQHVSDPNQTYRPEVVLDPARTRP